MRSAFAFLFVVSIACGSQAGDSLKHVCGNGPHTVKVLSDETRDECHRPPPRLKLDDTYEQVAEVCTQKPIWFDEEWTDWPECRGAEREVGNVIQLNSLNFN